MNDTVVILAFLVALVLVVIASDLILDVKAIFDPHHKAKQLEKYKRAFAQVARQKNHEALLYKRKGLHIASSDAKRARDIFMFEARKYSKRAEISLDISKTSLER